MKSNIWLFTKSKEGRKLLHIKEDILVVTFDTSVRFSTLLSPNNFPQNAWNIIWADTFCQAFGILDATKNFLIEHLSELFKRIENPTLSDLYKQIKETTYPGMSRYSRYKECAINRLGGLLNSPISNVINTRNPSIEVISRFNGIYEIQYLTAEQQVFFVNILTIWLYYYKLYNETSIIHFIGLDDANLVFDINFERRPERGLPIISHLLSTVRKSKIIVICCSQIPRQLGASIHSNSFAKIMFSLSDGRDIECMIKSMGIIDREQIQYCYQLDSQELLIKFSARYQAPFLAYVPFISFQGEQKSNEYIIKNNKRLFSLFSEKQEETITIIHPVNNKENYKGVDNKETIDTDLIRFLFEVYNHNFHSITQHYSNLNLSAGKGNRIVKQLVKHGLVRIIEINLGGKGGSTKFLEISEQGYKSINLPQLKYSKGTGFEHWFWQIKIAETLKKSKNSKVTIEANLKDKFIDLLVEYIKDNKEIRIAIEISITSTPKDEKTNIIKDLESGADYVIIVCQKDKIAEINKMIASLDIQYREKTYSCLLPELLKTNDFLGLIKSKKSI